MRKIKEVNVRDKRVIVRCDFNVPLEENGEISDDFRIRSTLPTINWLMENGAKIILMSHLGDPKGEVVEKLKMDVVRQRLSEHLKIPILKTHDCVGRSAEEASLQLKPGEILLLENLRFHKEEEENDNEFAKKIASLADIYVNDAFGTCHRAHASISGVPNFIPGFMGLLLEKEINSLDKITKAPKRPLVAAIGGAKVSTKIKLMKELMGFVDHLLIGGVLANTILKAQGIAIGRSKVDETMIEEAKSLNLTDKKFHLPLDVVTSEDISGKSETRIKGPAAIGENELILDIGPDTLKLFEQIIKESAVVFWNGPMGLYEVAKFSKGTIGLAETIAKGSAYSIIGGGDVVSMLDRLDLSKKINHISTGGGAMLAYISGEKMPGLLALENSK